MNNRILVEEYFLAEERGDVEAVVAMCDDQVIIRNAAQPSQSGKQGARDYVTSFRDRTSRRSFKVLAVAEEQDVVFSWWAAELTFRAGVQFGPLTTKRPFDIGLHGICRFKLNPLGRIVELDVFHETSTVFKNALEAAN